MANVLDSVTLVAPVADPNKNEGENFIMSMQWTGTGGGKPPVVNLYWEYRYDGTFYAIPILVDGLYTDSNEELGAKVNTQFNRTVECNTGGIYYVRARAYDTTNSIEKVSPEQIVTVSAAVIKATQYLAGKDCPPFPHEMDLLSEKLPCPL